MYRNITTTSKTKHLVKHRELEFEQPFVSYISYKCDLVTSLAFIEQVLRNSKGEPLVSVSFFHKHTTAQANRTVTLLLHFGKKLLFCIFYITYCSS